RRLGPVDIYINTCRGIFAASSVRGMYSWPSELLVIPLFYRHMGVLRAVRCSIGKSPPGLWGSAFYNMKPRDGIARAVHFDGCDGRHKPSRFSMKLLYISAYCIRIEALDFP